MKKFRSRRAAPRWAVGALAGAFLILAGAAVSDRGQAADPPAPAPAPVLAAIGEKNQEAAILSAAQMKANSEMAAERGEQTAAD